MIKRAVDILLAIAGCILLLPIFLIASILVYWKIGSPIFFKQERPGKNSKPFFIYKFRTMTNERDENGNLLPNEMRLQPFGKKLRRTSIDELPSLINVLKGEMSLVGPRPLRTKYLPYFTEEQNKRHRVKPGITGYAQVNGRSTNSWEEKFELDIWYVENQNIWLDFKIMYKTIINVIRRKDTTPQDQEFEIPFDEYIQIKRENESTTR